MIAREFQAFWPELTNWPPDTHNASSVRLGGRRPFSHPAPGHLLPIDLRASRLAQLLKLRVEHVPVGADADIIERPGMGGSFRAYLTGSVTP